MSFIKAASARITPQLSLATSNIRRRGIAIKTPIDLNATGPMFRYQKNLPKLPVPALSSTLKKYLESVRPYLNESEFRKTEQAVERFEAPGGIGQELQKRLLERAEDPAIVNWMEKWWSEQAYMGYRDPVVVYVSYFFLFKDDVLRKFPAQRAAAITTAALEFKKQIAQKVLEPENIRGTPLCMDSFKYMFNGCRVPQKPVDYEVIYELSLNHVVVLRKNRFYVVNTVHQGKQLSTAELEHQFQTIIDQAGQSKGLAVGALTTDNRDSWTDYRDNLIKAGPDNRALLEKIESSDFIICLDDSKPVTRDEGSRACWHGDGRNRFFDKPLQFIVFENGKAGFAGEHACMDGMATCRLNEFVCDGLARNKIQHGSTEVRSDLPKPNELVFQMNEQVKKDILSAESNFDSLIGKHELTVLNYQAYGKDLIKKFKCSPDGYAQMVIQLAYYKMFGVCRPTYESAQTRKYQRGRTETARTVTTDSVNFVKIMEDPHASVTDKIAAFRKAVKTQGAYMADAVNGLGVDRHLFGLKNSLKKGEDKPEIFRDPVNAYSSHWYLSTSQLSSEHFDGYGWGQVVNDGFGVAYMIKNHALQFNVASVKDLEVNGVSYKNGTHHFKQYLEEAANDLKQVMDTEVPSEAKL